MSQASCEHLRAFERARWARQAEVVRAWLQALPAVAPQGDALHRAFGGATVPDAALAQMRFDLERDRGRLSAAIAGKTPSAVGEPMSEQAFARHEALHALDNALVFVRKVGDASGRARAGAAVERAQRWIQRLRWELLDTGVDAELPLGFSADALEDLEGAAKVVERALVLVRERLV